MRKVFYTAAHHGFPMDVPLGGGAAVCRQLLLEWERTRPFPIEVISPTILGAHAPRHKDLVRYGESEYARFCVDFEKATTARLLREDPGQAVVLANDVCEGPDFQRLAAAGFRLYTIYHVDVVDYVARLYLRGLLSPERLTRFYTAIDGPAMRQIIPTIVRLLFPKQQDSVRYSKGLIVPSQGMKEVLLRCYPDTPAEKIHVVPWGIWETPTDPGSIELERQNWASQLNAGKVPILLMLSRISREKRQDRLLQALLKWEKDDDFPESGICVVIAGEPAYMHGFRFERRLRDLASQLRRTKVIFAGFAAGARKKALFQVADLYVFPSEHESYGLTLLEALQQGLPALAAANHGTRDLINPEFGRLVHGDADSLLVNLKELVKDRQNLKRMGQAARAFAGQQGFEVAAARLAAIIARN